MPSPITRTIVSCANRRVPPRPRAARCYGALTRKHGARAGNRCAHHRQRLPSSGTLINDVSHDGKPYVSTARHCENGQLGGGNPSAAANGRSWDATSPCGSALGTLYPRHRDPARGHHRGGAAGRWLLLLSQPPAASDAYFAGIDATAAPSRVATLFTMHSPTTSNSPPGTGRRLLNSRGQYLCACRLHVQFLGCRQPHWYDRARRFRKRPLRSEQPTSRLPIAGKPNRRDRPRISSVSASPPPNPTSQNALALFTSLAAVWDSTADPTGSVATLRQVLDPNNTATLVVDAIPGPASARLTPSELVVGIGATITLSWSAVGASSCTASGGTAGDAWAGTLAASGNQPVVEYATGMVTYGIRCAYPDGHLSTTQVTVNWLASSPEASVSAPSPVWAGGSWPVTWFTNDPPCELTYGTITQTLSGNSGTINVTQTTPGTYDYRLTCGNGSPPAIADATVDVIAPSIIFYPNTTDLRLGQAIEMRWDSLANSCTAGGGSTNDGWSGTQFAGGNGFSSFFPTVLGTYTYTLNCVQGAISVQASATVSIENDPPYATLSVSNSVISLGQTVTVSYKSNMAACILGQNAVSPQPQGVFEVSSTGGNSEGTNTYTAGNIGASQFTFACDGANNTGPPAVSATPQTVTVRQAALTASISAPADAVTGTPFTLSWQTAGASSCSASGGGADGTSWSGNVALPSGQMTITPNATGSFTYTLTCMDQTPSDTTTVDTTINVTAATAPPPPPPGAAREFERQRQRRRRCF